MTQLVAFYRQEATDTEGRRLAEVWAYDDQDLETVHDFIQWLFPLPEPSAFNPDAPLLTPEDVAAFHEDPALRANLLRSFDRILTFLGLVWSEEGVSEGPNFAGRAPEVWAHPNHNWLRITRILRSLTLLGRGERARGLFAWLERAYQQRCFSISAETFRYWSKAVQG